MDQGPLVTEEIDAGAEMIRRFNQYAPIKVAFWLRAGGDDAPRSLYLTSDQIQDADVYDAYGETGRLIDEIDSPYLTVFNIKVIDGTDPLALSVAEINKNHPKRHGTRLRWQTFGDLFVEDIYIYPPSVLVAVP